MKRNRTLLIPAGIILLFLLQLLLLHWLSPLLSRDGIAYVESAKLWGDPVCRETCFLHSAHAQFPLFISAMSLGATLFHLPYELSGQLICAFSGVLFLCMVYLLCRQISGNTEFAVLTVLILAFSSSLLSLSLEIQRELPYLAGAAAFLFCAAAFFRNGRWFAGAGMALTAALAMCTRIETFFLPAAAILFFGGAAFWKRCSWKLAFNAWGWLAAAYAVVYPLAFMLMTPEKSTFPLLFYLGPLLKKLGVLQ